MSVTLLPESERPDRLLVIVAHPADADRGFGGSIARWSARGTVVHLVCCTSGDATGDDAGDDPLELAARHEHEQREAAALLGCEEVTFMHRPEGALANDLALREQLVRIIRTFGPDTVATCDPRVLITPWGRPAHVDHRAAGVAAVDAVHPAAANAMAFSHLVRSEGLRPHQVSRLCLFWTERATHVVDIGATLAVKARALEVHSGRDGTGPGAAERVGAWARREGQPAGVTAGEAIAVVELA